MRFAERLTKLKKWTIEELCEGREMKAPAPGMDISGIVWRKPECWLAWAPASVDKSGMPTEIPENVAPSILVMPNQGFGKYVEEKRFDQYKNIHRAKQMGQHLPITFLFTVYEPGIRLPGFAQSAGEKGRGIDTTLIMEGTEEGLLTLYNWMDDCMSKLLGQKIIRETDLAVDEETVTHSLYTDSKYVVDRRPLFYGFVNVDFNCYANEELSKELEELL